MMSGASRGTSNDSKPLTAGGCLVRLLWLLVGPAILVLSATVIAQHRGTFLSWADAVFGGTVLLLIAIRHLDLRHFGGLTGTGEPATVG